MRDALVKILKFFALGLIGLIVLLVAVSFALPRTSHVARAIMA